MHMENKAFFKASPGYLVNVQLDLHYMYNIAFCSGKKTPNVKYFTVSKDKPSNLDWYSLVPALEHLFSRIHSSENCSNPLRPINSHLSFFFFKLMKVERCLLSKSYYTFQTTIALWSWNVRFFNPLHPPAPFREAYWFSKWKELPLHS